MSGALFVSEQSIVRTTKVDIKQNTSTSLVTKSGRSETQVANNFGSLEFVDGFDVADGTVTVSGTAPKVTTAPISGGEDVQVSGFYEETGRLTVQEPTNVRRTSITELARDLLVTSQVGKFPEPQRWPPYDYDSTSAHPIYAGFMPDAEDVCLSVIETEGTRDGRYMMSGAYNEYNGFQVKSRANDIKEANKNLRACIMQLTDRVVGNIYPKVLYSHDGWYYRVWNVSLASGPLFLGKEEESRRWLYSANFLMKIDWLEDYDS